MKRRLDQVEVAIVSDAVVKVRVDAIHDRSQRRSLSGGSGGARKSGIGQSKELANCLAIVLSRSVRRSVDEIGQRVDGRELG